MKQLLEKIKIPHIKFAIILSSGLLTGLILFLLYISNFTSYLSDSPEACMNCHVMAPEYATWYHSSHYQTASCNDCHVPQGNLIESYGFKAIDGLKHSFFFTTGFHGQAFKMGKMGEGAVQKNCERCHLNSFSHINTVIKEKDHGRNKKRLCWDCHRQTPHGKVRSLSSTPNALVPGDESMVPAWLRGEKKKENIVRFNK